MRARRSPTPPSRRCPRGGTTSPDRDPAEEHRLDPTARIHPTAEIEDDVTVGARTAVWSHVHMRGPGTRVGRDCIVGEKAYLGPGVVVGDLVKLNAMVYLPTGVTIGDGVLVGAGAAFTNDRYPRATDPGTGVLADSGPGDHTLSTRVEEGATIGTGAVVGCGLVVGRWSLVGMGATVTRDVPAFHLVVGNPARSVAVVGREGTPLLRFPPDRPPETAELTTPRGGRLRIVDGAVVEVERPAP